MLDVCTTADTAHIARPIQRPSNTVQVLTNLTVEVGGTSVLLESERR
jgi:hypothetical protein